MTNDNVSVLEITAELKRVVSATFEDNSRVMMWHIGVLEVTAE
jgi:hypothetical protein